MTSLFRIPCALLLLLGATLSSCTRPPRIDAAQAFSHQAQELPPLPGNVSPAAWTLHAQRVLAVGVTPDGATTGARAISYYSLPAGGWKVATAVLPRDVAGETFIAAKEGVLLLGRPSTRPAVAAPLFIQPDAAGDYSIQALPALPGIATAAAISGGIIYVAISSDPTPTTPVESRLVSLPLGMTTGSWADLGPVDPSLGRVTRMVAQGNGERPHLFLHGGIVAPATGPAFATYEPQRREWQRLAAGPGLAPISLSVPVGIAHLYAFESSNAGPALLRIVNTVTRAWADPIPLPITGSAVAATSLGTQVHTLFVSPTSRPQILESTYTVRAAGLHAADYVVIVLFVAGLTTMGIANSKRFKSADSYFRGGKNIPWLAAGLSVVATGQSATSFISIPGRTFATNWQFSLVPLTNVFGALIMSRYFVRFFVRLNLTSGYEYLQVRFSSLVRTIGSINYLLYELTRISLLVLVPAVAVSAVTKIDISTAILLMGFIATLYTTLGGLEGVVWADVVQICVKISAILVALGFIFGSLRGNLLDLVTSAWHEGKLHAVDWSFDLTRDTIWAMMLFWLTDGLKSYVANQTTIQRFISTRDLKAAQGSIRASAVVGTLIFWTFMVAGTGLYLFYRQNPGRLDLTMDKPDAVFPWFIVFELPPGVAGFLITALIAAALSSLYGALNSTSTVMVTDFYRRFSRGATDAGALRLGRRLTVMMGVLATGLALLLAGLASRSLVEQTLSVIGLFGGGLGGLFLVGMLTTRVSARAALTGFFISALVQFYVSRFTPLHWLTYMFTGMGSCFVASWLASFLWPEEKDLKGLTIHTYDR